MVTVEHIEQIQIIKKLGMCESGNSILMGRSDLLDLYSLGQYLV